jgi:hypothetical protein
MTPDPYQASGGPSDPQSWNRYAYTRGDPVNRYDPWGTQDTCSGVCQSFNPIPGQSGLGDQNYGASPGVDRDGGIIQPWNDPVGQKTVIPCKSGTVSDGQGHCLLNVTNLQTSGGSYNKVKTTFQNILDSIDPSCLSFLQSGGGNLQSYVSQLLSHNLLAVANFTATYAAFTGTAGSNVPQGAAAIVVNNTRAFFSSGYTVDQDTIQGGTALADVFILLHELGHALGANGFQDDYNNDNTQAGKTNDQLIQQNCQKTLSNFQ